MKYLTRVRISLLDAARLRLSDSYAWHRTLWQAFPDKDGGPRDFLTRVDRRGGQAEALILSPQQPIPQSWGRWESKLIPTSFLDHEQYRFSLRANPTVKRVVRLDSGERKRNGQRTGIYQAHQLEQWIERKAALGGFRITSLRFDPPTKEVFWRKRRKGTHVRVDFHGVLEATDRELFRAAFAAGIGPARAFGFGMLLLQTLAGQSKD